MFAQLKHPIDLENVRKEAGQSVSGVKMITRFNIYGLAVVLKNKKLGLIDDKFKLILPIEFDSISNYTSDGTAVVKRAGICVIIGINGKKVKWIGKR
ncbi:MAG: WG repeat-containing protein [bacterium]